MPVPATTTDVSGDRDLRVTPGERGVSLDLKRGITRVAGDPATFMTRLWSGAPKVAFVLVPAFALLTMAHLMAQKMLSCTSRMVFLGFTSCV